MLRTSRSSAELPKRPGMGKRKASLRSAAVDDVLSAEVQS